MYKHMEVKEKEAKKARIEVERKRMGDAHFKDWLKKSLMKQQEEVKKKREDRQIIMEKDHIKEMEKENIKKKAKVAFKKWKERKSHEQVFERKMRQQQEKENMQYN